MYNFVCHFIVCYLAVNEQILKFVKYAAFCGKTWICMIGLIFATPGKRTGQKLAYLMYTGSVFTNISTLVDMCMGISVVVLTQLWAETERWWSTMESRRWRLRWLSSPRGILCCRAAWLKTGQAWLQSCTVNVSREVTVVLSLLLALDSQQRRFIIITWVRSLVVMKKGWSHAYTIKNVNLSMDIL